jgi:hypothetical protein
MTRFAFGEKFGNPGNPPRLTTLRVGATAPNARGSSPESAIPPSPQAVFAKKCRRVIPNPATGEFPLANDAFMSATLLIYTRRMPPDKLNSNSSTDLRLRFNLSHNALLFDFVVSRKQQCLAQDDG